jgi:hypothetical protein
MEISLANSQQDIITAINKLETIGYVTEFDKILNNLAIEHWHNGYLDLLRENSYQGKVQNIGGFHEKYGAYYALYNPNLVVISEVQDCLNKQLRSWIDDFYNSK